MFPADQALRMFVWSSWPAYLLAPSKRPGWLRVDRLLGEHYLPKDSAAGRKELERQVEDRRAAEQDQSYTPIRRGWCLGGDAFRQELLAVMGERLGREHYGDERSETGIVKAEQIIRQELDCRKWTENDLQALPKSDPAKVGLARRLRAETVQSVAWIAQRLHMGSRNYANHLLWRARKKAGEGNRVVNNKNRPQRPAVDDPRRRSRAPTRGQR